MSNMNMSVETTSLGPRKTLVIMVTVVGCIAFLWPKVFYPMILGSGQTTKSIIKDHRGQGCCDVVLDHENVGNVTIGIGDKIFRKNFNIITGEVISVRQERPPHLRPESLHPAMRERGRNIPPSHAVPIIERTQSMPSQARVVEGRPGPIPGMRPPMGAGSIHQSTPKSSTMGFLMPLYTIAIVSFFIYTVMKLVLKKPQPYAQLPPDPNFHKQVFNQEAKIKRPDDSKSKLVVTAIQGLIDAADEEMKRKENATNLSKDTKETPDEEKQDTESNSNATLSNGHISKGKDSSNQKQNINKDFIEAEKKSEINMEKDKPTVKVLGMEMTASVEGGLKWSPFTTPKKYIYNNNLSTNNETQRTYIPEDVPPPQSIYLEGTLPHESQILVADSAVVTETLKSNDLENEEDEDEAPVILSSKMTLSLISLDSLTDDKQNETQSNNNNNNNINFNEDIEKNILDIEEQIVEPVQDYEIQNLNDQKPDEILKINENIEIIDDNAINDNGTENEEEEEIVDKIVIEEALDYEYEDYDHFNN